MYRDKATEHSAWQWQRADNGTDGWSNVTWHTCPGGAAHEYTLEGDEGKHLRTYVYYTDGEGARKRAQTEALGPVTAL